VSFHSIKPLDENFLGKTFGNFNLVATIEEHSVMGGFGSCVLEFAAKLGHFQKNIINFGTPDSFFKMSGSQSFARKELKIDAESIANKIKSALIKG
jgi:transketolase